MARVELGPIVQSIRGSVGGCCFRKIGAHFFCNLKSQGPVSPGKHSAEHRVILQQTTSAWLNLDAPVRQFWERYHALAQPLNPRTGRTLATPYALFLCYQNMRMHTGAAMLLDSVPDPPIFSHGTLHWFGPFCLPGAVYEGTMFMSRKGATVLDSMAIFAAMSRTGRTPSKFQRKIFPTPEYGPGYSVFNSNYLVYEKFGYPPGLTGLTEQPAPDSPLYMCGGWGLDNNLIWFCPWTLPVARGTVFKYPPALPLVNI